MTAGKSVTEVQQAVLAIFRKFNVARGEMLLIQSLIGEIAALPAPQRAAAKTALGELVAMGLLEEKPGKRGMYFLTEEGEQLAYAEARPAADGPTEIVRGTVWDSVKDGDLRIFCFMSVDVAEHSEIAKRRAHADVERAFAGVRELVEGAVLAHGGRIWGGWQGDGGLCVFMGDDRSEMVSSAVACGQAILEAMGRYNEGSNPLGEALKVRIAVHIGDATYRTDTGSVQSHAINFVCHLEKRRTVPGSISASASAWTELSPDLRAAFTTNGVFEGQDVYSTRGRIIPGLSEEESEILGFLICEQLQRNYEYVGQEDVLKAFPNLKARQIGQAVAVLQKRELVDMEGFLGCGAYGFHWIQATAYGFVEHGARFLEFDPKEDARRVLGGMVSLDCDVDGAELGRSLGLNAVRVNSAVGYLEHEELLEVDKTVGTAPYNFDTVAATPEGAVAVREGRL